MDHYTSNSQCTCRFNALLHLMPENDFQCQKNVKYFSIHSDADHSDNFRFHLNKFSIGYFSEGPHIKIQIFYVLHTHNFFGVILHKDKTKRCITCNDQPLLCVCVCVTGIAGDLFRC